MQLEPISKLQTDIKKAAGTLSNDEARFLVDQYYIIQDSRMRAGGQLRSMADEPHETLEFFGKQFHVLEQQTKNALDAFTAAQPIGIWLRSVKGIGPVLAAGLIAHIDIDKAPTVGHIWSYAGLNPNTKWEKKTKRPWNAKLKTLCWKIGESFVKVSGGKDPGFYGLIYKYRKEYELQKNEAGDYAEQAQKKLKKISKSTEAYKFYSQGKLPPAHIQNRVKRYAVKLFLAHMHEKWFEMHFGEPAPLPYPIAHMEHKHIIKAA